MSALADWIRRVYPRRTIAITSVITLIVWFAGPLGTFEAMNPVFRLVYWGGLIFGSVPFGYSFRMAVTCHLGHLKPPASALVIATGFSIAYSPIVFLTTLLAARFDLATMVPIWTMWAGTFLAAACAYTIRGLLIDQDNSASKAPLPGEIQKARLLLRVETDLRGRLQSISVRDHYVDVWTDLGKASLLMRFSDAVTETEGVEGAQVHRSHWVAWEAVQRVERQGGNLMLRMEHGALIPVSRIHRTKLEDRGLV